MVHVKAALNTRRPLCTGCDYYYVTWETGVPHGCRAMGFKSRDYPYVIAQHVSGMVCQMYRARKRDLQSLTR
jgi:hypothetical protein